MKKVVANIRKISAGPSPKLDSMTFEVGQEVYGGHIIQSIVPTDCGGYTVYILKGDDIKPWKFYSSNMPISLEYDIKHDKTSG